MFAKLRALLDRAEEPTAPGSAISSQRRAVAALLVEIARADHDEKPDEHEAIASLLRDFFAVDAATAAELLLEARGAVDDATSLREFTAPLHQAMSYEDRQGIVAMLWDVAVEDRIVDKYEDYLVGKIAELLYVSRADVIRLRYQASRRREAGA